MKLYKKVFVNLAKVLPDSIYLRMVFFSKLKRKLDLSNPKSYNEKLNWLKINDRKEHYQIMVDKYEAKKYVADKIGEQYVIYCCQCDIFSFQLFVFYITYFSFHKFMKSL